MAATVGRVLPFLLICAAMFEFVGQVRYTKQWRVVASSQTADAPTTLESSREEGNRDTEEETVAAEENLLSGTTKKQIERSQTNSNNDGQNDFHRSTLDILDLQNWEIKTLQKPFQDSCITPEGVTNFCCLNSPTNPLHEKKKRFDQQRTECGHVTLETHQWIQQLAREELIRLGDTTTPPKCDVCRVVNVLHQHDLKLAFLGDSMSSQIANAFACELQRRHYKVALEEQSPDPKEEDDKNALKAIRRMEIRSPTWHHNNNHAVVVDFLFQYRLPMKPPDQQRVALDYDVLVVNFGHHWVYQPSPTVAGKFERKFYNKNKLPEALALFFNTIGASSNQTKLLIWRENSASHFDANGGDYSLARANIPGFLKGTSNSTCVPYYDHSPNRTVHAWREKAFAKGVREGTNYTLVTSGPNMPPPARDAEIVVLPFYDFSMKAHQFHRSAENPDCLHFCYSPFLYLPVWRGMRLALERGFG